MGVGGGGGEGGEGGGRGFCGGGFVVMRVIGDLSSMIVKKFLGTG